MQPTKFDPPTNPYAPPLVSSAVSMPDTGPLRPFQTIWTHPRDTVRRIVKQDPALHVMLLACLAGVGETLDRASMRNAGDQMPLIAILGVACVIGPLGGLLSLWISSHLIRLSGTWIGGIALRDHIKTAIAWGSVPLVFALPLWIPQLLLFGSDMFTEEMPRLEAQPLLLIPFLLIGLLEIVLALWSVVIVCNTIAEVQGFRSAWRGLANIMLAGAVLLVPLLLFVVGIILLVRM
ncbi:MAG: Yip1 family protein [Pirellulaceae bacterium]